MQLIQDCFMLPSRKYLTKMFKNSKPLLLAALLTTTATGNLNAQTKEQMRMEQEQNEHAAQQFKDDKVLRAYFATNNIKPKKTIWGLYYTVTEPGDGPKIKAGNIVSLYYTGRFLDGKIFDSNIDSSSRHGEGLTVEVGSGRMIKGMDDGIQQLKKGGKATLYLPSPLGYGAAEKNGIPANSILIFSIEVADVKKGGR